MSIRISTRKLDDAVVGKPYSAQLQAEYPTGIIAEENHQGRGPRTWSIVHGALGAIKLDTATGLISGVPENAEILSFTAKVEDSGEDDTKILSLKVQADPAKQKPVPVVAPASNAVCAHCGKLKSAHRGGVYCAAAPDNSQMFVAK